MKDFVVIWLNPRYCNGARYDKYHNVTKYAISLQHFISYCKPDADLLK